MKFILKYVSCILCAAMLLALCGCGGQPAETTGPADSTGPADTTAGAQVEISTDAESYTVTVGQMVEVKVTCSDAAAQLAYAIADETIATVNKYGKVVGVRPGTTQLTITAPDGTAKTVEILVEGPQYENVLRVALNVLYNDTVLGCYNTEYGPYVEVYEDGQYTVTFDATMHLSESARTMGVTGLDNLTAIFLYDHEVRVGNQPTSSVTACQIRWDKITVNGQELTITNNEFKSAIKTSGIFDTNDPFNAWDSSSVAEVIVDTESHVLNIDVADPVSVSITFTVQGLEFAQ